MRRRIAFDECDSAEEVCGWLNKIRADQDLIEAKTIQNAQAIEALKPKEETKIEPKPKSKKKGKKKMKSKGSVLTRTLAILMLVVAIAGLCYAAYVPTDITSEIADNPDMLSVYLRDVLGTMQSNSYLFTPTLPANAPPLAEGRVWYDTNANALMLSVDGLAWTTITAGGGNSLDAAYNLGHGITVDGTAITLTVPDAANNSALSIVHQENTNFDGSDQRSVTIAHAPPRATFTATTGILKRP